MTGSETTRSEASALAAALKDYPAATIYEAARKGLGRLQCLDPAIRPLLAGSRVCGPARTVQTHIGTLLPVIRALEAAQPGEVIVVEAGGTARSTAWGGTFSLYASLKGIAGLVTNASVRDLAEIRALNFPVFALGASVRGALLDRGDGAIDIPVAVGNVVIAPGDIVVGDDDGVMVVPLADAERLLPLVRAQQAQEAEYERLLRAGKGLREALGMDE